METKMCFRFPFHDQGVGRVVFAPKVLGKGDNSPENSVAVEGKLKATGNAIEGKQFSEVVSSAIAFSFVYHNRHKDRETLIQPSRLLKVDLMCFCSKIGMLI